MHRWKNVEHPAIPKTIQEIRNAFQDPEIKEKYGDSYDGDGKFYIDTVLTPDYDFTVFASPFVMEFIEKDIPATSRSYLMDGTFDSLPKGYYQLLIISIEYENHVGIFSIHKRPLTFPHASLFVCCLLVRYQLKNENILSRNVHFCSSKSYS